MLFDLAVSAKWEGMLVGPDGTRLGGGDGDLEFTDFDQDSGLDDYPFSVNPSDDGGRADMRLCELMKTYGVPLLKRKLAEFAAELRAKD